MSLAYIEIPIKNLHWSYAILTLEERIGLALQFLKALIPNTACLAVVFQRLGQGTYGIQNGTVALWHAGAAAATDDQMSTWAAQLADDAGLVQLLFQVTNVWHMFNPELHLCGECR